MLTLIDRIRVIDTLATRGKFDSIQMMRIVNNNVDYHEFGYYLDQLNTKKFIKVVGFNSERMEIYQINP